MNLMQLFKSEKLLAQWQTGSRALMVAGLLATPGVYADNTASAYVDLSKSPVIGAASVESCEPGLPELTGYCRVLSTELGNSGTPKDLVIGLSFETMLMTETVVKSKGGTKSTSEADASIEMYVLVDGEMALPGQVIFDKRTQTLWATLGGVLDCTDLNGDGIVSFDECDLTDEEIGLALDTAAAHTFNFLAYDIGSGSHTIEAYARLSTSDGVVTDSGSSNASAALGKGTLSVWEVHGSNTN
jgi:hypothetical protein